MSSFLPEIKHMFAEAAGIDQIKRCVEKALESGASPLDIVHSMRDGLEEAGRKYERGEFFLSELIMAGMMAQEISNLLKPQLVSFSSMSLGKVVIGTVEGDIHDLGKNLVSMMLSSAGFQVVDLGVDVSAEALVRSVLKENAAILAMSCLLTAAMDNMKDAINRLNAAGVRSRVKVLVGGRPITADFAREIGANGYGESAIEAVNAAKSVLKK
jgi:methylmalonyl-CoA mutase cobalamin-binding domain/chain